MGRIMDKSEKKALLTLWVLFGLYFLTGFVVTVVYLEANPEASATLQLIPQLFVILLFFLLLQGFQTARLLIWAPLVTSLLTSLHCAAVTVSQADYPGGSLIIFHSLTCLLLLVLLYLSGGVSRYLAALKKRP